MTIRRTLIPKSLIQILSLCISQEGEQICRSWSYMATLHFLNLLLPLIYIHLEIVFFMYWPVMTFSGQRKWIPLGIQDLVAGDDFCVIKLVVSHYVVSIQVSMMMVSGYVCGNVCLSVWWWLVVTQGVSHSGVNHLALWLGWWMWWGIFSACVCMFVCLSTWHVKWWWWWLWWFISYGYFFVVKFQINSVSW